jgi:GrpB-like predicted nucleotidyltransferase (UPF0157 family)
MSIFVVPHNPAWSQAFESESHAISHALGGAAIVLHHIGSTAIPGILAKPIIDMLGEVDDLTVIDQQSATMQNLGYEVMGEFGIDGRRYFRKYDRGGHRTHHLHFFAIGSPHIERHIAFREYLRSNLRKAAEYSNLKARITSRGGVSRVEYMDAKASFVEETERMAIDWYRKMRAGSGIR